MLLLCKQTNQLPRANQYNLLYILLNNVIEFLRLKTVLVGMIFIYYFDSFWYTCQLSRTRRLCLRRGASFVMLFFTGNFLLRNNMTDKYIWKHDLHEGYSVEDVYHTVNQNKQQDHAQFTELIWNKAMPLKCLFLYGELYIRGFQPKTISIVVWLFIQALCCVLVVAGKNL